MTRCAQKYMQLAIKLAQKGTGKTFPNPLVGAVIVKGAKLVGSGYHKQAGGPHAEIAALRKAKKRAKGATLYVTLEPCAHYGKTPPCVDSIVESGIKKVYLAMRDPNPLVNGRGIKALRKNGIEVRAGICKVQAKKINADYVARFSKKNGKI
ncbi:MAG: bifunctional diaminohydroxyphosphoribosylaminopyrimidine deaminase/5-amino-6-(5-phosphoribosylamino)uracil reductase RibD [Candidatus Omnitrophota bacterium]